MKKLSHTKIYVGMLGFLALAMSGCGTYSKATDAANIAATTSSTPSNTSTPVVTNPVGDPGNGTPNLAAPYNLIVSAIGNDGSKTVSVRARKVLKIKFIPGTATKTVSGSGYTMNYSQLSVDVTVNGTQQNTGLLYNGFFAKDPSKDAQASTVMDFSSEIDASACSSSDPYCRVSISINVDNAVNDYWCMNWGMYCPATPVHYTHPWNGTLVIQTDDTSAI